MPLDAWLSMTASMRNQRVRLFIAEEIGTDGFPRKRYRAVSDAWARVEPPTGRDLERFEGTSHSISAVITFDLGQTVPEGGMVRVLPGDDGMSDYRVISVLPRLMSWEQHVYASSMFQNEEPHEVVDGGPVARIVLTPATFMLAEGVTQQLSLTAYDVDGNVLTGRVATYESADEDIATVDENGLVTGVAGGEVSIIARCENATTAAVATVTSEAPVASVTVTPKSFSIAPTGTQQLTIVLKDAQGNVLTGRATTCQSSDSNIASVTDSGLVTGKLLGNVAIVVSCEGKSAGVVANDAWTPAQLPGLKSWLKADAGITLNGSKVSAWADQSGNSASGSQATAAKQPTFVSASLNGLPVVRFDGAATFLQWALSLAAPYTVAIVWKNRALPGASAGFSLARFKDGSNNFAETTELNISGYQNITLAADVIVTSANGVGFSPTLDTAAHKLLWSYATGGKSDPTKFGARLDAVAKTIVASGAFGATSTDPGSIGGRSDNGNAGSLFANLDIAEIVVCGSALSLSNQQILEAYLLSRWGI